MSFRARAFILAVAALVATGVTFSGAAFTAGSADPGNTFTASNAFNLTATMTDPGAYLRATVSLQATASDGEDGSSITSVTIQRSPAGVSTWTDVCTDTSSPYSCSFDTTAVGDGLYDFRAVVQNDAGGSANSSPATNRRIDNTAPTAGLSDPGTPLRGTVGVSAFGTDGGSGVANVKVQRSPADAGTWTDICTDTTSPYSCSWDTTAVSDGLFDLRAVTSDNAGNSTNSSTVTNRRVDNTAPTATMTNPGSPITGTHSFDGTSTDTGGSGVASLTFQVSPAGAGTWSDMCSDTTSPYLCSYDTSSLADGQYDFRSLATDNAGNTANSTVYSGLFVDNTAPTVSVTDPGQYLQGTVTVNATAGDGGGSGVAKLNIQRSPAGADTWTDICTDTSSPYQCSWATTSVSDGLYDLRAIATDNASLQTTSSTVSNRVVDNTAPTASDVQTTNVGGGTQGRPENGDTVTFTYSEQMSTTSILAGWNGASTAVTVHINNNGNNDQLEIWNAADNARLPLTNTFVTLNGNFVTSSATFSGTMVQSGASITVTLGALTGGTVRTENSNVALSWPSSATATDIAGNACTGNTATESGGNDKDF